MSNKSMATIATMGIDIGKNSFHVVGLDRRGAIVLRQKWSRGQIEARLAALDSSRYRCRALGSDKRSALGRRFQPKTQPRRAWVDRPATLRCDPATRIRSASLKVRCCDP